MAHSQALAVDGDSEVSAAVVHALLVKVIQGAIHARRVNTTSMGEIGDLEPRGQNDVHI